MNKITKEQRKAYNRYIEEENKQTAAAAAAAPLIAIINLILAFVCASYLPKPYGGYLGILFILVAVLFAISPLFKPNQNEIEKKSQQR